MCTFCASLLRNFRAYAFVLAGYSALIVGVPAVMTPDQTFSLAVARVTEIGLGIVCVSLLSVLVWPRSAGGAYLQSSRAQLIALIRLVADTAAGELDRDQLRARRQALIADGMALENLREHALFDSPRLRNRAGLCRRLGHEMLAMISSVGPLHAYVNRYAQRHHHPSSPRCWRTSPPLIRRRRRRPCATRCMACTCAPGPWRGNCVAASVTTTTSASIPCNWRWSTAPSCATGCAPAWRCSPCSPTGRRWCSGAAAPRGPIWTRPRPGATACAPPWR
ncbi:hypothetical protein HML84_03685 [Alcanivorax sp. IO_7]|nr:hypothetical protein HML84_03685 [Alcanivorax sp. IO_7]